MEENHETCFICNSSYYSTKIKGHPEDGCLTICFNCHNKLLTKTKISIFKKMRIEIAHCLHGHEKCGKIHGHSVDVVVGIRGPMSLYSGMVMDFKHLKKIVEEEVGRFDHTYINKILPIPTAEYFALYLFHRIAPRVASRWGSPELSLIRIYETENNYVEYDGNGIKYDEDV